MLKRIKQERAITLIALVITIIVLLILAAISIAALTGENGLLEKAGKAKEETKIAEYKESLELIGVGLQPEKVLEQLSSKEYMDRYEEGIGDDEKFQYAKEIERKDDETIKVITKEGYVYVVKVEKVEYIGKQGENPPPDLQESDVTFHYEPTDWTNGSVEISIETEITGYTLQYSIDEKKWTDYTTAITMKDNGAIHARLINNLDEAGGYATGNVENIDRLEPNSFTPTATSTTNSITLTGSTTDKAKTATDGCSGIAKYYFSKDNGSTWEPSAGQTGTSYTFTGLTQNKTYSLKMKAVDKAGNETITNTVSKNTGTVTGLTDSNVKFTYNPSTPTKSSVAVTITTEITGYTLQYSTNGTTWTNYTTAITMTDNGAIYARLWDGTNGGGYATGNVENIDRLAPNSFTPTATSTTNSITLKGSTTDKAKTATDGCSGIAKYYFSKDNGSTWEPSAGQTGTSYTFTGLTQNKSYSLKMKAVDKAGNETITSTLSKSTTGVPGLTESNTTFTYNPSTPTNGNVAVTITTTAGSGYTLQYSTDGTTWKDYTTAISMTQNGAIYARVKDSTGQVGGTATGNVTNIDKLAPNNFTPTATSTTNSITLKGSTTDKAKTATNASSGIKAYYFSKDNGATWLPTGGQTTTSYTFSGLTSGTTYSLKMKAVDNAGNEVITSTITKTTLKLINSLKAGEYVNYIDKNGTTRKCIVLYDSSSSYGVQIITADTVENVQLGNGTGSKQTNNATYFKKARNSYNNAISTLNTKANSYLNTTYASSARCVGSVPNNPSSESTTYFTANSSYTYMSSYNGTFKKADKNYTSDWNQMKALNIYNLGKYYWLASRNVLSASYGSFFYVRTVDSGGSLASFDFCDTSSSSITYSYGTSCGFRPVFTLKSGIPITGGAGTSNSPYNLN